MLARPTSVTPQPAGEHWTPVVQVARIKQAQQEGVLRRKETRKRRIVMGPCLLWPATPTENTMPACIATSLIHRTMRAMTVKRTDERDLACTLLLA